VLEAVAGANILELGLHHRPEISRRVVAELNDAAWLTLEHENHPPPNLRGWHRHSSNPRKNVHSL
jgi:hypothetical protein